MSELINLKDYDTFMGDLLLDEGLTEQDPLNRAFLKHAPIKFSDGSSVTPREIVDVVEEALKYLSFDWPNIYDIIKRINIVYLAESNRIKTMAVNRHLTMFINAGFVHNGLKMDIELIAAVLCHEGYHVLFDHLEREKNWLSYKGKPLNEQTHHDCNLAADVEVNRALVKSRIISRDRLVNEIHGLYLDELCGGTDVIPMEMILENEKWMNMLRSKCPSPADPDTLPVGEKVKTTEEWDNGYKDGWNKIAGLIKKYGMKKTFDKLAEAGIVNAAGEMYKNKDISDVMVIDFIQVKSYDDYVKESMDIPDEDKYKTYDDGFTTAVGKLVNTIYSALNPEDGGDEEGESAGGEFESGVKPEDLEPIQMPQRNKKSNSSESNSGGMPQNIRDNSSDDSSSHDGNDSQGSQGGQGKSDDEITDDDKNKLKNDILNKDNQDDSGSGTSSKSDDDGKRTGESGNESSGQRNSDRNETGEIGGTGSYIDDDDEMEREIMKDSGYNDEDIEKIEKIIDVNRSRNSKEGIDAARDEYRKNASGLIRNIMDKIKVESQKYIDVWKQIMERFLSKRTRRAGRDKNNGHNDWVNKKMIGNGQYGIHRQKTRQDPQDINVYVDVSGSMNIQLLEIICKSLAIFGKKYQYSGINLSCWASTTNGVNKVDSFSTSDPDKIVDEILQIVSVGTEQCGGGTEKKAVVAAMVSCIEVNLKDPDKKTKDDVHVVISDGFFDLEGVENTIRATVKKSIGRSDIADKAVDHTFWMIYDAPEDWRNKWDNEIKKGTVIHLNSERMIERDDNNKHK